MDKQKIERLYQLLERAERERDTEAVAALRWAIFSLENNYIESVHIFDNRH